MLPSKSSICFFALAWVASSSPVSNAATTTGGSPTVLYSNESTYGTMTASILKVTGDTTTFKMLTATGYSDGTPFTYTPTITMAPSSYGVDVQSNISIAGVGQATIEVRDNCTLTSISAAQYLVGCHLQYSVGGNFPTAALSIAQSILSSSSSLMDRMRANETFGPLITMTATPQRTSGAISQHQFLQTSVPRFIMGSFIVAILVYVVI
jgi:hypothetical protein